MFDDLENLKDDIREYLKIKLDLLKLNAAESLSRIFCHIITIIITFSLLLMIVLFMSISAGFYLSSLLKSNELGFLCVAGFYFLLLIILLLFKKKIIERPVIKSIVKLFFSKSGNDEKK